MSDKTKIEWTDATWNPVRGCSRVSEGCRNCYAERVAARFSGPGLPYEGLTTPAGTWNGKINLVADHLTDPLRWKKPRKIFVNSMSDLFHESVPDEWIDKIFAVMRAARQHTFQVLTKRPERMREYLGAERKRVIWNRLLDVSGAAPLWPLPNVWLGVSVEDQKTADERIPHLLRCPAAVRWLSVEPMLGPVEIKSHLPKPMYHCSECGRELMHNFCRKCDTEDNTATNQIIGIDWVVCGGESGPGARPMHPDWARSLRDQCQAAGVPFFFKQWGEHFSFDQVTTKDQRDAFSRATVNGKQSYFGARVVQGPQGLKTAATEGVSPVSYANVGKKAAGRLLDGRTWDEFPQAVTA